jgi:glycosyltransferase 2 family protein
MSRGVRIAIGIAISVVALYLAFPPRSEWGHVRDAFARVQYVYALPLMLLSAYSMVVRCQRWQLLLRPLGHVPFMPLFSATCIGFFCNMVLPLRVGEVVRPVLLARRTKLPVSSLLGSVLLERLLDMVTILLFLGTVVLLVPVSDTIRRSGIAFLAFAILAISLIVALQRRHAIALRIISGGLALLPATVRARAEKALHGFIDGLQGIGGGGALVRIMCYSLYLWCVIATVFGIGFIACGLPVPFVSGALTLVTVVAGAVSAPSAPGFIGTFQAGCIVALALFGIDRADAVPYSFVVWAVQWLAQIVLGIVFLLRENVSFRDIQATEEDPVAVSDA